MKVRESLESFEYDEYIFFMNSPFSHHLILEGHISSFLFNEAYKELVESNVTGLYVARDEYDNGVVGNLEISTDFWKESQLKKHKLPTVALKKSRIESK